MTFPKVLVVTAAAAAALVYGVVAGAQQWFPYPLLVRVGWVADPQAGVAAPVTIPAAPIGPVPVARGGGGAAPSAFWRPVRAAAAAGNGSTPMAELANLPYLAGNSTAPETVRIGIYDAEVAYNGLNLVVSAHGPEAELLDMKGNVVHTWRCAIEDVWPGALPFATDDPAKLEEHKAFWRRAHVFPNGDLLAVFECIGLVKLDRDSRVVWSHLGQNHHDFAITDEGVIYTLTRRRREPPSGYQGRGGWPTFTTGAYWEDFVTVLSADGVVLREFSLLDCFANSDFASLLVLGPKQQDLFHTNTIELLDGRFAAAHPMLAAGHLLLSIPTINTIAIVNPEVEEVVWTLVGMTSFQHQPTILENGNMLVFDNLGAGLASRVLEIDPSTQAIVWSYRGSGEHPFESHILGSAQRLANGNTLITESTAGRAFEVLADGSVVWEYLNPHRAGDDGELIASLFEVVRFAPSYFAPEFAEVHTTYGVGEATVDLNGVKSLLEKFNRPK